MANITQSNIDNIILNIKNEERTVNTTGAQAFDHRLIEMYKRQGYNLKPKNSKEADAMGEKNFNGLSTSFSNIQVNKENGKKIVTLDIAPMRFLFKKAMEQLNNEQKLSLEQRIGISPQQANVSLIAPFKQNGNYFLLGQVKGKADGSGQIHAGLVAGGIDYSALQTADPMVTALRQECLEELGMDLNSLNSSSFSYILDESELGGLNFGSVASNVDINNILQAYDNSIKNKFLSSELEVQALASFPMAGISVIPLENGIRGLNNVDIYLATENGIQTKKETRGIRPYSESVIDFVQNKKNLYSILEKAGF
jgi:hypothetical protein